MSKSCCAMVVAGAFDLEVEPVFTERTKYDEDTGEPYVVKIESHKVAKCNGRIVASTEHNPDALCDEETIEGLRLFIGEDRYGRRGKVWIGKVIVEVNDWEDSCSTDFDARTPEEVKAFAAKYQVEPKLRLTLELLQ